MIDMEIRTEQSFYEGLINYEKDTRFVKISGNDLLFNDYTHLKVFNETLVISPSAYHSINNQMQISGNGFSWLSGETKTIIYNECLASPRLSEKEFLVIITNDEIKALMISSDDKRSFSPIESSLVLKIIRNGFENRNIPLEFRDGVFDDYYMVANYKLCKTYYPGYQFSITVVKSSTGYSSLKIIPIIERGRLSMQMKDDELSYEHKGDIREKVEEIPYLIDASFERIVKRANIKIEEEISDVYAFCVKKGINIRTAKYIKNHFKGETIQDLLTFLEDIEFTGPHGESKEVILGNFLS